MAADTTVKFFHSAMTGAPTLTGQAGSLTALLDALLINGFGTGTLDSVVVAGGIATANRSTGHPFEVDSVALLSGATGSYTGINGEKKILSRTTNTYTFDATGLPDGTVTGTVVHKFAPAGWDKPFSATNVGVYKSNDPAATGMYLRVDDTASSNARNARVRGYETMSDANTGTGLFPTDSQIPGGYWWAKSNALDATSRTWMFFADSRFFMLCAAYINGGDAGNYGTQIYFGDLIPVKTPDAYACVLGGSGGDSSTSTQVGAFDTNLACSSGSADTAMAPRSYTGIGGSTSLYHAAPMFLMNNANSYASGSNNTGGLTYPNPGDGGIYLTPMYATERLALNMRGVFPGFAFCPQRIGPGVFAERSLITGVAGLTGRKLCAVPHFSGVSFVDITGPWR